MTKKLINEFQNEEGKDSLSIRIRAKTYKVPKETLRIIWEYCKENFEKKEIVEK